MGTGGGGLLTLLRAADASAEPLRLPPDLVGPLVAAPASATVWPGRPTSLLTLGGAYPSPTLRARTGDVFELRLENRLAESNENNNTTRILVNLSVPRLGDANLDGHVNSTDFNILRSNFGRNFVTWTAGDFTGDRRVNFEDFQILETYFDSAPPAPAPPSPIRPTAGPPRR